MRVNFILYLEKIITDPVKKNNETNDSIIFRGNSLIENTNKNITTAINNSSNAYMFI